MVKNPSSFSLPPSLSSPSSFWFSFFFMVIVIYISYLTYENRMMWRRRAHVCHEYHELYSWRKNCHVEKFWEILEKFWRNFGKFGEILRNLGKFCHNFRTFMWRKIEPISTFVEKNDKYKVCGIVWKIICTYAIIAKDCLLTLIKSRLALGTLGCSVGRHHAKNGPIHRKMVVDCVQVITSKVKLFFRPEKRNEWSSQSFA